jgi:hypothetical protein
VNRQALGVVRVAVVMVVLVAITTGCQSSRPAHVRADLVSAFGAPFDSWSDARIDRFGEQVCTRLDSNLSPSDPADAPRWIHYFSPGVLQVFHSAYCA